jgi:hypothetical protein
MNNWRAKNLIANPDRQRSGLQSNLETLKAGGFQSFMVVCVVKYIASSEPIIKRNWGATSQNVLHIECVRAPVVSYVALRCAQVRLKKALKACFQSAIAAMKGRICQQMRPFIAAFCARCELE